jgi:hypothetical protein
VTPIIGRGGKLRGYIRHVGNRKELLAPGGRYLGFYDEDKDQTFRVGAIFYGYGDQLMDLLEN